MAITDVDVDDETTWRVLRQVVAERVTPQHQLRVSWHGSLHADEWVAASDEAWVDGTATWALEAWRRTHAAPKPKPPLVTRGINKPARHKPVRAAP